VRLAALVAVAACYRGGPEAPSNHAAVPATTADPLAYLPIDADVVAFVDLRAARASSLWKSLAPPILQQSVRELDELRRRCGFDPVVATDSIAVAVKGLDSNAAVGVVVIRGVPSDRTITCATRYTTRNRVTIDHGVTLVHDSDVTWAWRAVGPTTTVVLIDAKADAGAISALIDAGMPLRRSSQLVDLYDHLPSGLTAWGLVNGNSAFARKLGSPSWLSATLALTDRFTLAIRARFRQPDAAARFASEMSGLAGTPQVTLDKLDVHASGELVVADVVATEPQLRALLDITGIFRP
jgi:hypothetical protein